MSPTSYKGKKRSRKGAGHVKRSGKAKSLAARRLRSYIDRLPKEVIMNIIDYAHISIHYHLRCTSRYLRDMSDVYLLNGFNSTYARLLEKQPRVKATAMLAVMKLATEVYRRSGFTSIFCSKLLIMLRSSYGQKNPFVPKCHHVHDFLLQFYTTCERQMEDSNSQRSRLMYTMTLMRLFGKFERSKIVSSIMSFVPLQWRVSVELKGPWMGTLWTKRAGPQDSSDKRNNLLALLAELLVGSYLSKSFKLVWECPQDIYVIGHDSTTHNRRTPSTTFIFIMQGSKRIYEFLMFCIQTEDENLLFANKWPDDQFVVNLQIICNAAAKWGCPTVQHLEIGPAKGLSLKWIDDDDEDDIGEDEVDNLFN